MPPIALPPTIRKSIGNTRSRGRKAGAQTHVVNPRDVGGRPKPRATTEVTSAPAGTNATGPRRSRTNTRRSLVFFCARATPRRIRPRPARSAPPYPPQQLLPRHGHGHRLFTRGHGPPCLLGIGGGFSGAMPAVPTRKPQRLIRPRTGTATPHWTAAGTSDPAYSSSRRRRTGASADRMLPHILSRIISLPRDHTCRAWPSP